MPLPTFAKIVSRRLRPRAQEPTPHCKTDALDLSEYLFCLRKFADGQSSHPKCKGRNPKQKPSHSS